MTRLSCPRGMQMTDDQTVHELAAPLSSLQHRREAVRCPPRGLYGTYQSSTDNGRLIWIARSAQTPQAVTDAQVRDALGAQDLASFGPLRLL